MRLEVTYEELQDYVKKHDLRAVVDFMHTYYVDKNDVEMASAMHGFAYDSFTIEVDDNYATQRLLLNKF